VCLTSGGDLIQFDEHDYEGAGADTGEPIHVCLYENRSIVAVVDMRSIVGVADIDSLAS
jgi:hypothetical protein